MDDTTLNAIATCPRDVPVVFYREHDKAVFKGQYSSALRLMSEQDLEDRNLLFDEHPADLEHATFGYWEWCDGSRRKLLEGDDVPTHWRPAMDDGQLEPYPLNADRENLSDSYGLKGIKERKQKAED